MFDTLVKHGMIVTDSHVFTGDIAIQDGRIAAMGTDLGTDAKQVLDATGQYVFPGGVDSHIHLNDPGYTWREDFPHGSAAAVVGGITTLVDMPLQNEPTVTNAEIMAAKEAYLKGRSVADYTFWGGLVQGNNDDLLGMHEAGAAAFKVFLAPVSSDYSALSMGMLREAFKRLQSFGGLAGLHCEEFSLIEEGTAYYKAHPEFGREGFLLSRPLVAELISVQNVLELAKETGARVHICHVSHPDVAEAIRKAQREGVDVSAETCAHYLLFTEDDFLAHGAEFKCAPPLRSAAARDALWEYVLDGTIGSIVADHSPCQLEEKDEAKHGVFDTMGGIVGLQSVWQSMLDAALSRGICPTILARAFASATADRFGIGHVKGHLAVGYDADLVLVDPAKEWTITEDSLHYLNPHSAYVGRSGKGMPVCTMVRGVIVAQDGKITASHDHGTLIPARQGAQ